MHIETSDTLRGIHDAEHVDSRTDEGCNSLKPRPRTLEERIQSPVSRSATDWGSRATSSSRQHDSDRELLGKSLGAEAEQGRALELPDARGLLYLCDRTLGSSAVEAGNSGAVELRQGREAGSDLRARSLPGRHQSHAHPRTPQCEANHRRRLVDSQRVAAEILQKAVS